VFRASTWRITYSVKERKHNVELNDELVSKKKEAYERLIWVLEMGESFEVQFL
jgi:hypothetical protein